MTFKERFLRGDCNMDVIHDWAAFWHDGVKESQGMGEFLGLTDTEYEAYCGGGIEGLANAMDAQVYYRALYLSWDELLDQLQALVQQVLGPDHSISVKRVDYYYWEMRLLGLPADLDEEASAKLCEQLELREIEPDHFMYTDSADNNQMLRLLGMLAGYEVSSSHADDDGVWIICKEYRTSSQEYADRLISDCEKRLRMEIPNRHYRLVDSDTACHQLFGFKAALKALGILPEGKCSVRPDHFADMAPRQAAQTNMDLPSSEAIQKALQCLTDNGIAADEAETVLQALGYILFDAEIV